MGKLAMWVRQHPEHTGQLVQTWLEESSESAMLHQRLCCLLAELEEEFTPHEETVHNIINHFEWQSLLDK